MTDQFLWCKEEIKICYGGCVSLDVKKESYEGFVCPTIIFGGET